MEVFKQTPAFMYMHSPALYQTAPKLTNVCSPSLQAQIIAMLPPSPRRLSAERRGQRHVDEMNPDMNVRERVYVYSKHAHIHTHIHISTLGYCGVSCCPDSHDVNHSCTLIVACSHQSACIFLFGTSEVLVRGLCGDGSWWWVCLVLIASLCTPIKFCMNTYTE